MPAPLRHRSCRSAPPSPASGRAGSERAQPVGAAIGGHTTLADLLARVHRSQDRLATIRPLLPEGLAAAGWPAVPVVVRVRPRP